MPGSQHWEFPMEGDVFSPEQLAWLSDHPVGIRALGRSPARGFPWWDELLPYDR